MRNVLLFLLLSVSSCEAQSKWDGGKITKTGVYQYDSLKLIVNDSNHRVEYFMLNSKGDTLIISDRKFSTFHRWALQIDKDRNLWVLSSDIGHSCWKRSIENGKYIKQEFFGPISKDSIPAEIYNTLKLFHPYSSQN